jgi:hypothetical protein
MRNSFPFPFFSIRLGSHHVSYAQQIFLKNPPFRMARALIVLSGNVLR